jgi:hypothetical protein
MGVGVGDGTGVIGGVEGIWVIGGVGVGDAE